MSTLRGFLPQQDSSYAGKVEAATVKGTFDSVFRILLPTQKTTYSGKVEAAPSVAPKYIGFIANVNRLMTR